MCSIFSPCKKFLAYIVCNENRCGPEICLGPALLPQGRPEATRRVLAMLKEMDNCGFGNCTNHRACENACPKEVSITHIARFNREFFKAALLGRSSLD